MASRDSILLVGFVAAAAICWMVPMNADAGLFYADSRECTTISYENGTSVESCTFHADPIPEWLVAATIALLVTPSVFLLLWGFGAF